jgi:hypothetical protein|nr:MAG TPA: hypothetical protein [Bacteriophage sp.]
MELKAFKIYIETETGVESKLIFAKTRRSVKVPADIKGEILKIKEVTDEVKKDVAELSETIKDTVIESILKTTGLL